jgi:ligand-binding sensor domain-containing protein
MDIVMIQKRLNKIPTLILGVLTYLVFAQNASAQYRFDVWTTDDGLPQNSVSNILQTSEGYLWMTTFDGLVRYDGVRFKVFNRGNTPGIINSRFMNFFEDGNKNLWITTEESGITCYRNGQFTTYTTQDGLPHNRISRTLRLREDSLGIVINTDGGPVRWRDGKLFPYDPNEGDPYAARGFPARPGVLWCVDPSGLQRIENSQITATVKSQWSSPSEIRRIFETPGGTVWIAAWKNDEIWRLKDGQFTLMTGKDALPKKWVTSICEDKNGNTWFGISTGGLYLLRGDRFTRITTADGLSSNDINAIYEDREGNIWIGTAGGLNRLGGRIISSFSQKDGLAADNVYPIYQDRNGAIWIGTWQGLTRFSNGAFTNYSKTFSLENENITAICQDRSGALWIGTWSSGGVIQIRNGKVTSYAGLKNGLDTTHVIYEDRAGALWFGTHSGLIKYQDEVFTKYTRKDGLQGEIVYVLLEDRSGALWIGTEKGLAVYKGGEFRFYTATDGLPPFTIRSLYEDDSGVLWIGTYDAGLYRYSEGRFTSCTIRDGLFNNGVFQILEDARGYFWISCNLGIYRVSRKELNDFAEGRVSKITAIPYGKREGMLNQECNGGNQPAGIKAADGKLWFPTAKGVAVIDPEKVKVSFQPPTVVIDEVTIDKQVVNIKDGLRVEPGRENFEVAYAGLSFIDPQRIEFRYRLVGLDSDWIEAGARRTAYYSHVAPGTYTFEVMAANRDGVWSERPAQFRVVIVPPFWQTWWFALLAVSLMIAAAILLYRRRISALKQAHAAQQAFSKQLLESQERERQRIAAELHDGLGQSLLIIRH